MALMGLEVEDKDEAIDSIVIKQERRRVLSLEAPRARHVLTILPPINDQSNLCLTPEHSRGHGALRRRAASLPQTSKPLGAPCLSKAGVSLGLRARLNNSMRRSPGVALTMCP
jgi:hypothetical protein